MKELKAEFERSVERGLENSLVRELAENIALDSKKHASFYQALIQHIENPLVPVMIESEMTSFIEEREEEGR